VGMSLRLLGYLQALSDVQDVARIGYSGLTRIGVGVVDQIGGGEVYVGDIVVTDPFSIYLISTLPSL